MCFPIILVCNSNINQPPSNLNPFGKGVFVIVWQQDLQLFMQSIPITTKVVNFNLAHGEMHTTQYYVMKFVNGKSVVFVVYSGFFSTHKTDRHDIAEILLKMAFKYITPVQKKYVYLLFYLHYKLAFPFYKKSAIDLSSFLFQHRSPSCMGLCRWNR